MTKLLALLLPFVAASRLGTLSFTQVQGVGWQATIRPPYGDKRTVNAWSGQARTMTSALRRALQEADAHPRFNFFSATFAPKLSDREFDDQ